MENSVLVNVDQHWHGHGEFSFGQSRSRASLVGDHFVYSRDLDM